MLQQIGRRFGPIPPAVRKRIEALPEPKLKRVAMKLLDVKTLDELLG